MRALHFLILLPAFATCGTGIAAQPCTNGSFEELGPHGFPVGWGPVGQLVDVTRDAHEGQYALRLRRTRDTESAETGLNRGGDPQRGHGLLAELRGGIDFYYKAVSADGAKLMVYVIPVNSDGVEKTGARRAEFAVPSVHIGDGQWHHARLKYDFSDNPQAKWVHFAARILGRAGELLLDDLSYVERTGPVLRFGDVTLDEQAGAGGQLGTLRIPLWNDGDQAVEHARLQATLPDGLSTDTPEISLDQLATGDRKIVRLDVTGTRRATGEIQLAAQGAGTQATTRIPLRPHLEIVSCGPRQPLVPTGRPAVVECILKNSGNVLAEDAVVTFQLPTGPISCAVAVIPPGETRSIATDRCVPTTQTRGLPLSVTVTGGGLNQPLHRDSTLVVGAATPLPPAAGTLQASLTETCAVLENDRLRCVFRHHEFGWGPGELLVNCESVWLAVAQLPQLSRLALQDGRGTRHELPIVTSEPPQVVNEKQLARLIFAWKYRDPDGANWQATVCFSLAPSADTVQVTHELACDQPRNLLAFDGPLLYALARDEAVFPGLEWLVDDDVSSSTLEIAAGHPDQVRYVVHPNMVTVPAIGIHAAWGTLGLLWDVHQRWDGAHDRPSVVFASPDRFQNQRAHLAGLFLPAVPQWVAVNQREAQVPYRLEPTRSLSLQCRILLQRGAGDALAPLEAWLDWQGLPDPAPLPHGSYAAEIEFSMRGYLQSLWIPAERRWWTSKGGGIMSTKGLPHAYVADLLTGAMLSPSESVQQACRRRAAELAPLLGGKPGTLDALRFPGGIEAVLANPLQAAGLLRSRNADHMWVFDADRVGQGVFEGVDYRELGPHEAVELGTTAQNAYQVLRYARIAGDRTAYELMLPTLERMATFRVPRAAQVWEVPVHAPDILAASDAMDAFLEAYRISEDARWLREAVQSARRGLPFVYLWDDPAKPFLVGASIPVFGATWYQGSWFGRPVQWNGLRFANSLLRLAPHDQSRDWRKLAETIIRSAIHQQDLDGENAALWPDNISAIDSEKCGWVFAPRQIIRNILKLTGRDEDPATVILRRPEGSVHITSTATLSDTVWDGTDVQLVATWPPGESGCVLITNITRPSEILVNDLPQSLQTGSETSCRYDETYALLVIPMTADDVARVQIRGAHYRHVDRLPQTLKRIAFEFEDTAAGWLAVHQVTGLQIQAGALVGQITGPDPYIVRSMLDVPASTCKSLRIRARLTAGQGGQLFWTTSAAPSFDETKSVGIPFVADGQFHEYRVELANHRNWTGQITALRIDPGGGTSSGEFAIDFVRCEP